MLLFFIQQNKDYFLISCHILLFLKNSYFYLLFFCCDTCHLSWTVLNNRKTFTWFHSLHFQFEFKNLTQPYFNGINLFRYGRVEAREKLQVVYIISMKTSKNNWKQLFLFLNSEFLDCSKANTKKLYTFREVSLSFTGINFTGIDHCKGQWTCPKPRTLKIF